MKFQKGKSGNPGGRPRALREISELCKARGAEALKRIIELMNSKDERVALAACQTVLDRGYGKPTQHISREFNVTCEAMTDAELERIAASGGKGAVAPADSSSQLN